MLDALINGMTTQAMQQMDHLFTQQIQNHLFRPSNSTFGLDLVALNIQRGRDHGIPSYNSFRAACKLPTIESFPALINVMPPEVALLLSQQYENINDVDLFVGGVAGLHFFKHFRYFLHLCKYLIKTILNMCNRISCAQCSCGAYIWLHCSR